MKLNLPSDFCGVFFAFCVDQMLKPVLKLLLSSEM